LRSIRGFGVDLKRSEWHANRAGKLDRNWEITNTTSPGLGATSCFNIDGGQHVERGCGGERTDWKSETGVAEGGRVLRTRSNPNEPRENCGKGTKGNRRVGGWGGAREIPHKIKDRKKENEKKEEEHG